MRKGLNRALGCSILASEMGRSGSEMSCYSPPTYAFLEQFPGVEGGVVEDSNVLALEALAVDHVRSSTPSHLSRIIVKSQFLPFDLQGFNQVLLAVYSMHTRLTPHAQFWLEITPVYVRISPHVSRASERVETEPELLMGAQVSQSTSGPVRSSEVRR
ncbi:hypothetical protein BV25DRAFT_1580897 [Artomyces pyxidatus]|uniref:Uncharacterized protein n=1 Tax=Artomyces pyxidatus TaxID=48021 RepID=A0ACB8TC67_9AGAM|nr:hypothetical protein BV25DRAFT_1580897 [Artomyces pyxidatus]